MGLLRGCTDAGTRRLFLEQLGAGIILDRPRKRVRQHWKGLISAYKAVFLAGGDLGKRERGKGPRIGCCSCVSLDRWTIAMETRTVVMSPTYTSRLASQY